METGVEVWVRDGTGDKAWLPALVTSKAVKADGKFALTVSHEDGTEVHVDVAEGDDELEDIKLRNDSSDLTVENLINLPHLHEPAILFCLEQRYRSSEIYTYTGPILIAVNPFKRLTLYTTQILESFYNFGLLKSQGIESPSTLGPHIYAVADASYRSMMTVIHAGNSSANRDFSANQAILISGESGAGKTESTKIVLRYLTTVGNSSGSGAELGDGSVMDKVLQSNPVLESFGNAKTIRNDNSSRFGKYTELSFNKRGHLIGGTIRTYLLEKVRLPAQQLGERNFHVFYQMIAGASDEERRQWRLLPAKDYFYTNQGNVYQLRDLNDADEYVEMRRALNTLNFDEGDQASLFLAMAGVLHLGQIQFTPDADGEGCDILKADDAAALLGVSLDLVARALTTRAIVTRDETMTKRLKVREAVAARDALAKAVYGRLFNWIVQVINKSIQVEASLERASIGVLDIFGFECFKSNSFEQLCINWTNETLQQQFNQFVFKMEQAEYAKEKIEWSFISFPDNVLTLDLIEHRSTGILAMLDDECRLPGAADEKLASRLYKAFAAHSRFSASAAQMRGSLFCIKHYAGPVVYGATTFVEKNKDELPKACISLMASSSLALLADSFQDDLIPDLTSHERQQLLVERSNDKKLSVSAQFKTQLAQLMDKVASTRPHYIRCLKPNDQNVPDTFHRMRTTEQLRYGGVLEAVRVARSGFPVRLGHVEFYQRYRGLANPFHAATKKLPAARALSEGSAEAKQFCDSLMSVLWDPAPKYFPAGSSARKVQGWLTWLSEHSIPKESVQLGLTKTFLRKQAHDLLEARRSRRMAGAARQVQSVMRCQQVRRSYLQKLWAARALQCVARGMIGRKRATFKRQVRGALVIQTSHRMLAARRRFRNFLFALVSLQSAFRSRRAFKAYQAHLYELRGARLSSLVRVLLARRRLTKVRRSVVALQCRLRQRAAKKALLAKRREAKDVGSLKQTNQDLKAEIELLRSRARLDAEEKAKEAADRALERAAEEQQVQVAHITSELEEALAALAEEKARRERAEAQVVDLQILLEEEKMSHASTIAAQFQAARTSFTSSGAGSPSAISTPRGSVVLSLDPSLLSATSPRSAYATPGDDDPADLGDAAAPAAPAAIAATAAAASSIDQQELLALRSELREEREAKLLLEDEASRLRRISMLLTEQMDTLRRSHAGLGPPAAAPGVTRRPDENPRRRYMISTTSSVAAKSKADIDATKKTAVGLRLTKVNAAAGNGLPEAAPEVAPEEMALKEREAVTAATAKFQQNLGAFRQKLQMGLQVHLWEGGRVESKFETRMRLSTCGTVISFIDSKAQKRNALAGVLAYFSAREEVAPVRVTDIFECFSSGDKALLEGSSWTPPAAVGESKNEHTLLTLVAKSEGNTPRTLVIQLPNKEDRNHVVSGFRMMINTNPFFQSQTSPPKPPPAKVASPSSRAEAATAHTVHRAARRLSKRDEVIEQTKAGGRLSEESRLSSDGAPSSSSSSFSSVSLDARADGSSEAALQRQQATAAAILGPSSSSSAADVHLKSLLQDEKIYSERLRTQALIFQNELHERDEEIAGLKKGAANLEKTVHGLQKMAEQLQHVQMQISKKLEQTLLDKEEAQELNDTLQNEIIALKRLLLQPPPPPLQPTPFQTTVEGSTSL